MGKEAFTASAESRLDVAVSEHFVLKPAAERISRSQIKQLIERGKVTVNGSTQTKAGFAVHPTDRIEVQAIPQKTQNLPLYEATLDIVFEDDALIVINKPAGLSVHPGAGNFETTLVNALLFYFTQGGKKRVPEIFNDESATQEARPGIVHRLDKDTTGLLVVAKTVQTHAALSKQFAERTVGRAYFALAFSTPRGKRELSQMDEGTIDASLSRHQNKRTQMAVSKKGGKKAVTHWKVIERFEYACLLRIRLETGRTHQIRVHLNAIQSPLIGDPTYGDFSGLPLPLKKLHENFGRQALHAGYLAFTHPVSGARVEFSSDMPADMLRLIEGFRSWKK